MLGATLTSTLALTGSDVRAGERLKGAQLTQVLALAQVTRNNYALHTESLADWVAQVTVNGTTELRQQIYTARVTHNSSDSIQGPNNVASVGQAMMETAVTGDHLREMNFSRLALPVGQSAVYSDHIHSGLGRNWVAIGVYDGRTGGWWFAWFDIANGVVGHKDSGIDSSGIEVSPYGWYRPWIKYVAQAGAGTDFIYMGTYIATADGAESGTPGNGANRPQYLGDVTKGVYVWGAMVDVGATQLNPYLSNNSSLLRIERASVPKVKGYQRLLGADLDFSVGVALSGYVRNVLRVKGASLTQTLALQGRVRELERLRGATLSQSLSLTASRVRELERLRGAFLTQTQPLSGRVREIERLKGATLLSSTSLTGSKIREIERLRGASLTHQLALAGRVREIERLKGASLTQSLPLTGSDVRLVLRLKGTQFGLELALRGKVRNIERLKGASLLSSLALSGKVRGVERLRGATITYTLPLIGSDIRGIERLKGAALLSALGLNGSEIRVIERMLGSALIGTSSVALRGTIREIERLRGATLTIYTIEVDSLTGVIHIYPELDGAVLVQAEMDMEAIHTAPELTGDVVTATELTGVVHTHPLQYPIQ
jgi:hypothetical protein